MTDTKSLYDQRPDSTLQLHSQSQWMEEDRIPSEGEEINHFPGRRPSQHQTKTKRVSQLIELGEDDLDQLDDDASSEPFTDTQAPRRSSVMEDLNEVSYHPSTLQLYAPPRQRQEWGQHQILPRVNWGDLFFDLFYVAAAYNASNILVESPSAQGCLYFLAAFLSVQYFWVQKMHYDARFVVTDDLYHRGFELLGLVILASVVLHIRPVSVLGDWTHSSAMFALALSLTFSWLYHIWRCLELFVAGQGQQSVIRAMAWREIGLASISLVFCIAATVVTGMDYYENQSVEIAETGNRILVSTADKQVDEHNNTSTYDKGLQSTSESSSSDLAIWLILSATVVHYSIFFVQVVFLFPNDGSHKNYVVPLNVDFSIHRYGEWTMLMLGESILSLLIVDVPMESTDYFTTFYCSLLTVIFVQYLHFQNMPHHADDHAMRRSKNRGMVWSLMKYTYSCALIALGAAFTLFIMSFTSQGTNAYGERLLAAGDDGSVSEYALQQLEQQAANLYSVSLALLFFSLDGMSLMNVGVRDGWNRCRGPKSHAYNVTGIGLVMLRAGLILICATLSQWCTDPEILVGIGLGVTISQILLRKLGETYLNESRGLLTNGCHAVAETS